MIGIRGTAETWKRVVSFLVILLAVVAAWEGYKLLGAAFDGTWPFTGIEMRPRPGDRSMPHVWDMVIVLFEPARRGGSPLIQVLAGAALFTLREALIGFVLGSLVGFGLGAAFVRSRTAERAFMPYVVISQTIPMIAIAPIVVIWGSLVFGIPRWAAVAILAAYLTFFPVAVNAVRGLRSPSATATELFHSYAASPRARLWKLQVPSALPYLFTALKISAAVSVVAAIVGELPAGMSQGLGRRLLTYAQVFTADPRKLYATVLVATLGGLIFVGLVAVVERYTLPTRMRAN